MKNHILIFILLIFFCEELIAQPTLAAYNSNPVSSQHYTSIGVNYIAPSNAMDFTIWDFSTLVSNDTFITRYFEHGDVAGDSLFPLSDVSRKTRNSFEFLITSNQGVSLSGYRDSFTYIYSDNADQMHYPFTYTDQFADNYTCKYVRKNDTINRSGNIMVSAPAYGNIKLPYATINNVLGVKIFETFSDFTKTGIEYHEITTWSWRVAGLSTPLISFKSENFNGNFMESGYFLSKESLSISVKKNAPLDVTLINFISNKFPDLYIESPNSLTIVNISCVNSTGKEIIVPLSKTLLKGQNIVELPDQNVSQGMYLIIIRTDGYQLTKRFLVTQ